MTADKTYSQYFETRPRDNGKSFVCCRDGAPRELRDMIYEIHLNQFEGALPNDWIYKTIAEAFEALEQDPRENINIEADPYRYDLKTWLMEPFADSFCECAMKEGLCVSGDMINGISCGQFLAKEAIYDAVDQFLNREEYV